MKSIRDSRKGVFSRAINKLNNFRMKVCTKSITFLLKMNDICLSKEEKEYRANKAEEYRRGIDVANRFEKGKDELARAVEITKKEVKTRGERIEYLGKAYSEAQQIVDTLHTCYLHGDMESMGEVFKEYYAQRVTD